jgi:hypothetical protein
MNLVMCFDEADKEEYKRDDEWDCWKTLDLSLLEMEDEERHGKGCCQVSLVTADDVPEIDRRQQSLWPPRR